MASADLSRINTNIAALNALNALNDINTRMSVHSLRLATGRRINSAADDAAGFTIATKLKVKSEGLGTALDNIGSAKNLMTVAEGHLANIQNILTQMKAKAQQAANATLGAEERNAILSELQQFNEQINSEVDQARWAGVSILGTGSVSNMSFQIGTGTSSSDALTFNVADNTWSAGTNTTFNSLGLNVVASGEVVKSAATSGAGTGLGSTTILVATSSTISATYGSELTTGTYTLEVSSSGSTPSQVTLRLKDINGSYVSIDQDGTVGGDYGTSLIYTAAAGTASSDVVNLGVGFTVDLNNVATGMSGSTVTINFSRSGNSVSTQEYAQDFMDNVDSALNKVSQGLSYVGSMINRLNFQEESLSIAKINTEAAYSRIVDADMAWEQLETTKLLILQQTATAMLSQANVSPQSVLALFG